MIVVLDLAHGTVHLVGRTVSPNFRMDVLVRGPRQNLRMPPASTYTLASITRKCLQVLRSHHQWEGGGGMCLGFGPSRRIS